MGRDQELRVPGPLEIVDDPQEGELALWRERSLRLVENVDALLEAMCKQREIEGDDGRHTGDELEPLP